MSDYLQSAQGRREVPKSIGGSGIEQSNEIKSLLGSNPPPIPNDSTPVVDLLLRDLFDDDHGLKEDFLKRKEFGIEKYGVPLQVNNRRKMPLDAYEESLDQAIYLRGAIEEGVAEGLELLYATSLVICRELRQLITVNKGKRE